MQNKEQTTLMIGRTLVNERVGCKHPGLSKNYEYRLLGYAINHAALSLFLTSCSST
jgi:hypothetical protein